MSCSNRIVKVSIKAFHAPISAVIVRLQRFKSSEVWNVSKKEGYAFIAHIVRCVVVGVGAVGVLIQKGSEFSLESREL